MINLPPPPSAVAPPPLPAATWTLASPGLRLVGGAIDVTILLAIQAVVGVLLGSLPSLRTLIAVALSLGYLAWCWANRGQSVGMMVFGFTVRDATTGRNPAAGRALGRAFVWLMELTGTVVLIGAVGWLWMFWDPRRQGLHDKVAGTIVTKS